MPVRQAKERQRLVLKRIQDGELTPQAGAAELGLSLRHMRRLLAGLSQSPMVTHNLHDVATSFVGRQQELAHVRQVLTNTQLLTLTGPAGCGKTRLALRAAADSLTLFPDGVWFVDLATLTDPALVPQSLFTVLDLREKRGWSVETALVHHLQGRTSLLVLDNCEHLVTACARLVHSLIQACTHLRVIATSREALGVPGERVCAVPPLSIPEEHGVQTPAELLRYEAVRLFVDRAQSILPAFALTHETALPVVQICRRLDGIPLAIELAARRVHVLSAAEIAHWLEQRFDLLTCGSRTAPPRQQTLRATVEWSYQLATEQERALWRHLSVFQGSFSLSAVTELFAGAGNPTAAVMNLLAQLVDKSIVTAVVGGQTTRYRLLETIRYFGLEKLAECGEMEGIRRRHRNWCLAIAEAAAAELFGGRQQEWLSRLDLEQENLRSALQFSADVGEITEGLRIASALCQYWTVRACLAEGARWLDTFLCRAAPRDAVWARAALAAGQLLHRMGEYRRAVLWLDESLALAGQLGAPELRAAALDALGMVASDQGDYPTARDRYEQSLALHRRIDDPRGIASCLHHLGRLAGDQGDFAGAQRLYAESLTLWRALHDDAWTATTLGNLANTIAEAGGSSATVRRLHEESLALRRRLGDKRGVAITLHNLGHLAQMQGDLGEAQALIAESLDLLRQLGDKRSTAVAAANMATVLQARGEFRSAAECHKEALGLRQAMLDRLGIAHSLEAVAHFMTLMADHSSAAQFFGAADQLRTAIGTPLSPRNQEEQSRQRSALRGALGEERFTAAWNEGATMSIGDAVACGIAAMDAALQAGPGLAPAEPAPSEIRLTARETEVLRLAASGLTAKEIGQRLSLSPRTVQKHEENIRLKVGLPNLVSLVGWAVRSGLV